ERPVGGADVILGLGPTRRRAHECPPRSVVPWERGRLARIGSCNQHWRGPEVDVRARRPRSQRSGGGSRFWRSLARPVRRQKLRNRGFLEQFPCRVAAT